jgi:hypothetical protein
MPPPVAPEPTESPAPKTEAAVARFESKDLPAGAIVDTEGVVQFPDGTKVTVGPATSIELGAQRVTVTRGVVTAEVSKKFAFHTAMADAMAVNATFRLAVTNESTRIEVVKGVAQFASKGKTVDVKANCFSVSMGGAPSAAQPMPTEETLVSFTFEDGKKSPKIEFGSVERGPGNRLCLSGVAEGGVCKVQFSDNAGFFTVRGDETVNFDYWVEAGANKVNMNILNRTQGHTQDMIVPKHVTGKWAHATLALADFGPAGDHPKAGDVIPNIYIQGIANRFYIDNLQITRPRKEK